MTKTNKAVLRCESGFKYNPHRNVCTVHLNGHNISQAVAQIFNAWWQAEVNTNPDQADVMLESTRETLTAAGAESYTLEDFAETLSQVFDFEFECVNS